MSSGIKTFRDLDVWQAAMDLVVECYRTETCPPSERYGLTNQIRRSSCSIPSNIAEGHSRRTTRVYLHHVNVALGSEAENSRPTWRLLFDWAWYLVSAYEVSPSSELELVEC